MATTKHQELNSQDPYAQLPVSLKRGREIICERLKNLPQDPGIYRFLDDKKNPLYIGKAKNLKRRVSSYARVHQLPLRLQRMIAQIQTIDITITRNEVEALLLESTLIKSLRPHYNVILKDDKSYPYIFLSQEENFPKLSKHRGRQKKKGHYFGPFVSSDAADRLLLTLEKIFLLRTCTDNAFAHRKRPCLLYQMHRCSAPCCDLITQDHYAELVNATVDFLNGKKHNVAQEIKQQMNSAAHNLDYEAAAIFRDRLHALDLLRKHSDVRIPFSSDVDVVAIAAQENISCVAVFVYRAGISYGSRCFFPQHKNNASADEILLAFLSQYYSQHSPPSLILLNRLDDEYQRLGQLLATQAQRRLRLHYPQKGRLRRLVILAKDNAQQGLSYARNQERSIQDALKDLEHKISAPKPIERIEIYDNSHLLGQQAYGAMVVYGKQGFEKNAYRLFHIRAKKGTQKPDDYAMLTEVLTRRFKSQASLVSTQRARLPDVILIDGGRGHLARARNILAERKITSVITLAIAKGPERKAGEERIYWGKGAPLLFKANEPVFLFLQRLRDEAHRFAISTHRSARSKQRLKSQLSEIPNIGRVRQHLLLRHFGSLKAVMAASEKDLAAVPKISEKLAENIWHSLHPEDGQKET